MNKYCSKYLYISSDNVSDDITGAKYTDLITLGDQRGCRVCSEKTTCIFQKKIIDLIERRDDLIFKRK